MNLEEYNKKLEKTVNDLSRDMNSKIMPSLGLDALGLLRKRIQDTGENAEGSKFPAYSTKAMLIGSKSFPTQSVANKVFGSKEKRKALDWRTLGEAADARRLAILQGGYKQWRTLMGRQTDHVDFSVSNEMWNDINIISNNGEHMNGTVIIGAKKESEKKKLSGNTERKGEILDLSDKEQSYLIEKYNLRVLNVFKENGL